MVLSISLWYSVEHLTCTASREGLANPSNNEGFAASALVEGQCEFKSSSFSGAVESHKQNTSTCQKKDRNNTEEHRNI